MTRNEVLKRIEIGKSDFVVDIGGGHRPFWRADLVIEKFPFHDSLHRTGAMEFSRLPVIKADALALPIRDGGCDLVFASHILEHLPDPEAFVAEIKRCARRVYLEFPSRHRELMHAWSFHRWLIEVNGATLRFYRNDVPQFFGRLFHEEYDAALGAWSEARHELLNTSLLCETKDLNCIFPVQSAMEWLAASSATGDRKINVAGRTHRPRYSLRENLAFVAQSVVSGGIYSFLARPRRRGSAPRPLPEALMARLLCLHCRNSGLRRNGEEIVCPCGARYRQDRGVFDFDVAAAPQAVATELLNHANL